MRKKKKNARITVEKSTHITQSAQRTQPSAMVDGDGCDGGGGEGVDGGDGVDRGGVAVDGYGGGVDGCGDGSSG